jgi:hypothetical protein
MEGPMSQAEDLNAALEFVIVRIERESIRSGEPLTTEQRFLLNNLPSQPTFPSIIPGDPEFPTVIAPPRDTDYERLIALAKSAHRKDHELNPALRSWKFATSVLKLNRHPMNWLLQWAGLKPPRPWWDQWLLILAAIILIASMMTLLFVPKKQGTPHWLVFGVGYMVLLLIFSVLARKMEAWQLMRNIETCRASSGFADPSQSHLSVIK